MHPLVRIVLLGGLGLLVAWDAERQAFVAEPYDELLADAPGSAVDDALAPTEAEKTARGASRS